MVCRSGILGHFYWSKGLDFKLAKTILAGEEKTIILKVVVIGQLFAGHDTIIPGKKGNPGLASNNPFLHFAIGFTRVVNKAGNRSPCGINDHVLVKVHQIKALLIGISQYFQKIIPELARVRQTSFFLYIVFIRRWASI